MAILLVREIMMNKISLGFLVIFFMGSFDCLLLNAMENDSSNCNDAPSPLILGGSGSCDRTSECSDDSGKENDRFDGSWRDDAIKRGNWRRVNLNDVEEFYGDHEKEIKTAEQVIDSLLGNKDGKLTPDEVVGILKKVGKGLVKFKNLIAGIFKKKDGDSSTSSNVNRRAFQSSIQRVRLPKAFGIKALKEKFGNRLNDAKELLKDISQKLMQLKDSTFNPVKIFVTEHEELAVMVNELVVLLDKDTTDVRGGFFEIGILGDLIEIVTEKIDQIERCFFVEVQVIDHEYKKIEESSSCWPEPEFDFMPAQELSRRRFIHSPEQAIEFFELLFKNENPDGKLSFKNIPGIISSVKQKIEKLKNLISIVNVPRKSNRAFDKAFAESIRDDVKAIGMWLIQLKLIAQSISGKLIERIDIKKVHELIEVESKSDEDQAIREQLERYAELIDSGDVNRAGSSMNFQVLGESLEATLKFIEKLEKKINAVHDLADQNPSGVMSVLTRNIDWVQLGSYAAIIVVTLNSILQIGDKIGVWNIF